MPIWVLVESVEQKQCTSTRKISLYRKTPVNLYWSPQQTLGIYLLLRRANSPAFCGTLLSQVTCKETNIGGLWPAQSADHLAIRKQSKTGGAFSGKKACLAMPALLDFECATVDLRIPAGFCWDTVSASLGAQRVSLAQEAQSSQAQGCSSLCRWDFVRDSEVL